MTQTIRYANVAAKMGSERGTFLSEAKLKTLTEAKNLSEFASQFKDTSYQERIAKIRLPFTNRKLERAFQESLVETYIKIIKNSPKTVTPYLQMYISSIEVENLKTLVKSVYTELDPEEKLAKMYLLVENFLKNQPVFEESAKAANLKQLVKTFKKTEYSAALNLGLKKYEEKGSTMFFDILLDKEFFEKLFEKYQRLPKKEKRHAFFYASVEIDSFILLMLLRGKALNYDATWLRVTIPRSSIKLSQETFDALIAAPDYESALNIVLKSHYGKFFIKAQTPEGTIANAQKEFRKALLKHAVKNRVAETFNIGAPLGFMVQKEAEANNLAKISLGVQAEMKPEDIQRTLLLPN